MLKTLLLALLWSQHWLLTSYAANWAQTTGPQSQNVVISANPGESYPHWTGREGMAVAAENVTDDGRTKLGKQAKLFLFGGDDHTLAYGSGGSNISTEGGGGVRNDVWYTEPQPWKKYRDRDGDVTDYNVPIPRVRSQMKWNRVTAGRLPPSGVTYKEWVQCQESISGLRPGVKSLGISPSNYLCANDTSYPALWVEDNMWSPRRYHQAAVYKDVLFVIGGEAREVEDLPHESSIGGIQTPRVEPDPFNSNWRERLVLKNDVWVSFDGGSRWKLANPGCDDPQRELLPEWTITRSSLEQDPDEAIKVAPESSSNCRSDDDCYGSASCINQADAKSEQAADDDSLDDDGELEDPIGLHDLVGKAGYTPKICVCSIFSPRKHHRVFIHDDKLYVMGGFTYTTQKSFCGRMETSRNPYESWKDFEQHPERSRAYTCGAQHRVALNDIWVSNLKDDYIGRDWEVRKPYRPGDSAWEPRGSFALVKMMIYGDMALRPQFREEGMSPNGTLCLWIMGGEGVAPADGLIERWEPVFYDDVWFLMLADDANPERDQLMGAEYWSKYNETGEGEGWSGRAGHVAVVEPATSENNYQDRVYIHGGYNEQGILGDVWSWGSVCESSVVEGQVNGFDENKKCVKRQMSTSWVQDYTPEAWYKMMSTNQFGSCQLFSSGEPPDHCWIDSMVLSREQVTGPENPTQYYVDGETPLSQLQKVYLPGSIYSKTGKVDVLRDSETSIHGIPPKLFPVVTADELDMLHQVGIHTVDELAHAHILQILKLRGFDYPEVDDRMDFPGICDLKALAEAILQKCDVDPNLSNYDGEELMSQNINIPWRHSFVDGVPNTVHTEWYGKDYTYDPSEEEPIAADIAGACGESIENCTWDGCYPVGTVSIRTSINVFGLGDVDQVQEIRDPYRELQELHCRWNPGRRFHHAGIFFDNKFYVMGGRDGKHSYRQDMWYRDDRLPTSRLDTVPKSFTSDTLVKVRSDEEGCQQEYKLMNRNENLEVRRWNRFSEKVDLAWLAGDNPDWVSAESSNKYTLYVRSVDPAGNVDPTYELGSSRNMYTWNYEAPTPALLIVMIVLGCLFIMLVIYAEYRRRKRKAAMQRYAIKRMRRKFKQAQKQGGMGAAAGGDDEEGGKKKKKKKKKKKHKDEDGKKGKKKDKHDKHKGDKKGKSSKSKDKHGSKDKDKHKKKKGKEADREKKKSGKERDREKKKSGKEADRAKKKSGKEADREKKKSGKEADRERKKRK